MNMKRELFTFYAPNAIRNIFLKYFTGALNHPVYVSHAKQNSPAVNKDEEQ
jgi:hypothetical protein